MKRPQNKLPQLVLITWRDACTYSGWRDAKHAKTETGPAVCESVGWLLENNKETVTIYATKAADPKDPDINSIISIPAAWVTKMQALNVRSGNKIPVLMFRGPKQTSKQQRARAKPAQAVLGGAIIHSGSPSGPRPARDR